MNRSMTESWVGLADAIRGVRAELISAMEEGEGEPLRFTVSDVDLEFAVQLRSDINATAGVKVLVVSVGGSGGLSRGATHTLKVTLKPTEQWEIGDQERRIPPRRPTDG